MRCDTNAVMNLIDSIASTAQTENQLDTGVSGEDGRQSHRSRLRHTTRVSYEQRRCTMGPPVRLMILKLVRLNRSIVQQSRVQLPLSASAASTGQLSLHGFSVRPLK